MYDLLFLYVMKAQWIKNILDGRTRVAMPIMTHPGIEYIGKSVREAVSNGEVHFEAIRAVVERFDVAACTAIMDLTVEAEAFGAKVDFPEEEVPRVTGRLVCDDVSVRALQVPDLNRGRLPEYLKANRMAVACFKDRPVFAGCIGPFSLAGRLFGMSEIMVEIYMEPDTIRMLLEKCAELIRRYCRELKRAGVAGIIMAEPAAGLLSDEDCRLYSTFYVRRMVEELQDENFSFILHNCGNSGQCTRAMVESGAAALHFGNAVDLVSALKECPEDVLVMGNIDPVGVFKQGTPEYVYRETRALLSETHSYANFVLSSGCDLPSSVPEENIRRFYRALADYNSMFS